MYLTLNSDRIDMSQMAIFLIVLRFCLSKPHLSPILNLIGFLSDFCIYRIITAQDRSLHLFLLTSIVFNWAIHPVGLTILDASNCQVIEELNQWKIFPLKTQRIHKITSEALTKFIIFVL